MVKLHLYLIWKNKKEDDCVEYIDEESLWKFIENNFTPLEHSPNQIDSQTREVIDTLEPYYYYKISEFGACIEKCNVRKNDIKIGSVACRECIYCLSGITKRNFIICKKIKVATKSN